MEKILLSNRYRDQNYLVNINEDLWELELINPDFTRFGASGNDWKIIDFVDPPGGPFMEINNFKIYTEIGEKILREIISEKPYTKILMRFENI